MYIENIRVGRLTLPIKAIEDERLLQISPPGFAEGLQGVIRGYHSGRRRMQDLRPAGHFSGDQQVRAELCGCAIVVANGGLKDEYAGCRIAFRAHALRLIWVADDLVKGVALLLSQPGLFQGGGS
ncbi:hypothetical protein PSFL6913_28520 [Pseudomonas fluorescens]|nr:hypothetical protein ALQ35_200081 [Pseudomonas fluorescens]